MAEGANLPDSRGTRSAGCRVGWAGLRGPSLHGGRGIVRQRSPMRGPGAARRAGAPAVAPAGDAAREVLARGVMPGRRTLLCLMSSMARTRPSSTTPSCSTHSSPARRDPVAIAANLAELRALLSPVAWRTSMRITPQELSRLAAPTLMAWGARDPVVSVEHRCGSEVLPGRPCARLSATPTSSSSCSKASLEHVIGRRLAAPSRLPERPQSVISDGAGSDQSRRVITTSGRREAAPRHRATYA